MVDLMGNEVFWSLTSERSSIEFFHARRETVVSGFRNEAPTAAAAEVLASEYWTSALERGLAESHAGRTQSLQSYLASSN